MSKNLIEYFRPLLKQKLMATDEAIDDYASFIHWESMYLSDNPIQNYVDQIEHTIGWENVIIF